MPESAPSFLDTEPPHWAARGLAYLLIALFVAVVILSIVVRVPETVSSPFVLIPLHGADPVRASQDGVVTEVRVVEGQAVKEGETIYALRADPLGDRSSELGGLEMQIKGAVQRLANAGSQYDSERLADEQEMTRLAARQADLERMIVLKQNQRKLSGDLDQRYDELQKQGFVTQEGFINRQLETSRIALELQQAQIDRDETRSNLEKLRHEMNAREVEHSETVRSLREETDRATIRIDALKDNFLQDGSGTLGVRAPCTGVVLRQQVKTGNSAVLDGDVLCELACSMGKLQAELSIPPSEIGRLKAGQGVKLLYDAFPYQRYGVRFASLRWISPASVSVRDANTFRALAEIADDAIQLQEGPRPLLAGMGGTAQVVVGSRSLISYAFAPIRALRERLSEPPGAPAK